MSLFSSTIPLNFRWLIYTAPLAFMAVASPALAQTGNAQHAREKEAKKACLAGKNSYEKGIEILAELYATTNEPTYIYNQGRCYQQNDQPELALSRFQEYLRKEPPMTPKEKATLENYMGECKEQIAKTQPPPQPAMPAPQTTKIDLPKEPAPTEILLAPPQDSPTDSGRGARIAGVTLGTLGLVTLGGAATMNWLYLKTNNKDIYSKDNETKERRYKLFAILGYAVGAASVVTGITLYLIGSRSENAEEPNLAFIPSILPGEATLSLRGAF